MRPADFWLHSSCIEWIERIGFLLVSYQICSIFPITWRAVRVLFILHCSFSIPFNSYQSLLEFDIIKSQNIFIHPRFCRFSKAFSARTCELIDNCERFSTNIETLISCHWISFVCMKHENDQFYRSTFRDSGVEPKRAESFGSIDSIETRQQFKTAIHNLKEGLPFGEETQQVVSEKQGYFENSAGLEIVHFWSFPIV